MSAPKEIELANLRERIRQLEEQMKSCVAVDPESFRKVLAHESQQALQMAREAGLDTLVKCRTEL